MPPVSRRNFLNYILGFKQILKGFSKVYFRADRPDQLPDVIASVEKHLRLTPATREPEPSLPAQIENLEARLRALERQSAAITTRLVAFLSFRFDGKSP